MNKILIYVDKHENFKYLKDVENSLSFTNIISTGNGKLGCYQYLTHIDAPDEAIDNIYAIKLSNIIGYIFAFNLYDNDINYLTAYKKKFKKIEDGQYCFKIDYIDEPNYDTYINYKDIKEDIKNEGAVNGVK